MTLAKLRFQPECLYTSMSVYICPLKENILHYKIRLLSDESTRWLYKQRIQQKLQYIPHKSNYSYTKQETAVNQT
jgi:hypothetical protein